MIVEQLKKAFTAFTGVVLLDLHPVNARNGNEGIAFPFKLALPVALAHYGQLSPKDLGQELPVAAGRLQETRVDPLGLVLHQVKHRIHFPLRGKHLPVVRNPLLRLDLLLFIRVLIGILHLFSEISANLSLFLNIPGQNVNQNLEFRISLFNQARSQ